MSQRLSNTEILYNYISKRTGTKIELLRESSKLAYLLVKKYSLQHEIFLLLPERASNQFKAIQQAYQAKISKQQCKEFAQRIVHIFDKTQAFKEAKSFLGVAMTDEEFSSYWPQIWTSALEQRRNGRYEGPQLQ